MATVGAFSTDELLAWLGMVKPDAVPKEKKEVYHVPPPGTVAYNMRLKAEAAREQREREARELNDVEEEEEELDDGLNYEPHYNIMPDDEKAFNYVDDYDPGNPTNPRALPGDHDYGVDQSTDVYDDFSFEEDSNPRLPIHDHKMDILNTINAGQVTVIQGCTGSGKSTQVPQFILEEHAMAHRHCNIICTQPRRIAAKSIAKFVANMHNWTLGSLVGYQIGMDKNVSEKTRMTFVTTGVLLEKLVNQRNMNQYTHVILDEVHERDKDTDFCLLVVRKLLRTNSPHVKVILMSATFETAYFASYFSVQLSGSIVVPPVIKVEGTPFPVHEFHLDDISHLGECEPMDPDYPRLNRGLMEMVEKLLRDFDRIEEADPQYGKGNFTRGTVLIFLPGLPEIMQLRDMLPGAELQLIKLLLHSSISWDEQYKVFLPPVPGKRKIILATNIAESSITVPDIKYVIDFCLVKQMTCDWNTKYCCLQTVWTSQASLSQRKGRAGRVSSGRCYRLITRDFYNNHIPAYSVPEMQRCPIENIVLKCKKLNMGEPRATLLLALQPPKASDIEMAITTLKEVGALTITVQGSVSRFDGDLTFVGKILEALPIDVKFGKLLVLGHAFGCLESCLVIAASLSLKSFFTSSPLDELIAYRAKRAWDESSSSDCLAILSAYKAWADMKRRSGYRDQRNSEAQWCKRNFLSKKVLNDVAELVGELTKRLSSFNIKPTRSLHASRDIDPVMDPLILKVVLSGSFFPNYFLWGELDEELCAREMSGHDPTTTVKVHGLPPNPVTYAEQLCSLFDACGPGKNIYFESQKAFIEFQHPTASRSCPVGKAPPILGSVYLSLWMRGKRNRLSLFLNSDTQGSISPLPPPVVEDTDAIPPMSLPDHGMCQVSVEYVVDAGHFWARFSDIKSTQRLEQITRNITSRPLTPLVLDPEKMVGTYCLARYSLDGYFYRAKIISTNIQRLYSEAEVLFIDYGNTELVPFDQLCRMNREDMQEPAQAFQCALSGVKPVPPYEAWIAQATSFVEQLTRDKHLMAHIYSLLDGVLRVELYDTNTPVDVLINDQLIEAGYAVKCEEPYQSRVNNAQAKTRRSSETASSSLLRSAFDLGGGGAAETYIPGSGTSGRALNISCTKVKWFTRPRKPRSYGRQVALKGPNSPFEVKFQSMANYGHCHGVRIQRDSINCVVINSEPQDKHQRMMVAAHVLLNPTGSSCVARDTTLLPLIPGLPHIICLIFARSVEMRCDELKRQYTGALCGLGCNPNTSESLYREHDCEVTFDTLFEQEDLNEINRIRMAINLALSSVDSLAEWGDIAMRKIQKDVREIFTRLIMKPRVSIPPYSCGKYGWNQVSPEDVLHVDPERGGGSHVDTKKDGDPAPYPMVDGIAVSGKRIDLQRPTKVLQMRERLRELRKKIASGLLEPGPVDCPLCRDDFISARAMRVHLETEGHLFHERKLFSDDVEIDTRAAA